MSKNLPTVVKRVGARLKHSTEDSVSPTGFAPPFSPLFVKTQHSAENGNTDDMIVLAELLLMEDKKWYARGLASRIRLSNFWRQRAADLGNKDATKI